MSIDQLIGAWLWDKYVEDVTRKAFGLLKEKWKSFKWQDAAKTYLERIKSLYSTMRVLYKEDSILLNEFYIDLFILDKPTALKRHGLEQLETEFEKKRAFSASDKRLSALRIISQHNYLFVLGKPGAGKTTLLKHLSLLSADGKIDKIPIFISLNTWALSNIQLMEYISRQFDICGFPDANSFIQSLLVRGGAMLLFDGLDEVSEEENLRIKLIREIEEFTTKFPDNKYILTCRIAATEYIFEKFLCVEIADFTIEQVRLYINKWFKHENIKGEKLINQLNKEEYQNIRDLSRNPLLLSLLCLVYDETSDLPSRRIDIYKDAIEILLLKWDRIRGLRRDEILDFFTLDNKRALLAFLAFDYLERGHVFFREDELANRILVWFRNRFPSQTISSSDCEKIVKILESQHGILVERAHNIYSFAHLTLQEYLTACYLVEDEEALKLAPQKHLTDNRWHEVFVITANLISKSDNLVENIRQEANNLVKGDSELQNFLKWVNVKAVDYVQLGSMALARMATIEIARTLSRGLPPTLEHTRSMASALGFKNRENKNLELDIILANAFTSGNPITTVENNLDKISNYDKKVYLSLVVLLPVKADYQWHTVDEYIERERLLEELTKILKNERRLPRWDFSVQQFNLLSKYIQANILLTRCIGVKEPNHKDEILHGMLTV